MNDMKIHVDPWGPHNGVFWVRPFCYISPRSMEDICKCKQYFWTLHNSLFHKLYLEAKKFVRNQNRCWYIWPKRIERIVEHFLLKAFVDQSCLNIWTLCSSMLKWKKIKNTVKIFPMVLYRNFCIIYQRRKKLLEKKFASQGWQACVRQSFTS